VDHVIPAGSLRSWDDLPIFAERLFCEREVDGVKRLQRLCDKCHTKKTKDDREKE
jgi:hypothetical protein